jgi:hypothetical protein
MLADIVAQLLHSLCRLRFVPGHCCIIPAEKISAKVERVVLNALLALDVASIVTL